MSKRSLRGVSSVRLRSSPSLCFCRLSLPPPTVDANHPTHPPHPPRPAPPQCTPFQLFCADNVLKLRSRGAPSDGFKNEKVRLGRRLAEEWARDAERRRRYEHMAEEQRRLLQLRDEYMKSGHKSLSLEMSVATNLLGGGAGAVGRFAVGWLLRSAIQLTDRTIPCRPCAPSEQRAPRSWAKREDCCCQGRCQGRVYCRFCGRGCGGCSCSGEQCQGRGGRGGRRRRRRHRRRQGKSDSGGGRGRGGRGWAWACRSFRARAQACLCGGSSWGCARTCRCFRVRV